MSEIFALRNKQLSWYLIYMIKLFAYLKRLDQIGWIFFWGNPSVPRMWYMFFFNLLKFHGNFSLNHNLKPSAGKRRKYLYVTWATLVIVLPEVVLLKCYQEIVLVLANKPNPSLKKGFEPWNKKVFLNSVKLSNYIFYSKNQIILE